MSTISFPTEVDLAITGRCNLRCKHCNASGTWSAENELTFEEIARLLRELTDEKIFSLNLFGGEPFSYPRITDVLRMLNDYPMSVNILTNGTLITSDIIKVLKKMKFLSAMQISIDGSTPEIHDWQRGEGSFDKAISGAKMLDAADIDVKLKAVINSKNYNDIENMFKMALDLGFVGMDFGDAIECGRAAVYAGDMKLQGEIHRTIMTTIFDLKKRYPKYRIGGTIGQKADMLLDFYENGTGGGDRGTYSTCGAGFNMMSIRSDAKVVPCTAFWTLVCGDARKSTLREIWNTSETLNAIRGLADKPLDSEHKECGSCDYLSYCNGGCRAAAYYSSGDKLNGIDKTTCLTFSDRCGFRIEKEKCFECKK